MIRWFGPYADRIQVAASGNLPYNQTRLAREGLGIYLVIRLDCAYDGLRFVPDVYKRQPLILALNQYAWHDVSTLALGMIALSWLVDLVSAFCRRRDA